MDLPTIPHKLKEWDIHVIDSLTLILSIEGENFDFKGHDFNKRNDELYVELCSMSNSLGGYIVLGIEECKAPNGFDQGQEDKINQSISNSCYNVEPTPSIQVEMVYEDDRSIFFPVIQIHNIEVHKPHFTKNRCQCYIRVGNSSKPASTTMVLNLLTDFKARRDNVQRLISTTKFVEESLMFMSSQLESINPSTIERITPIDLSNFRDSISLTEWLISDQMGGHIDSNKDNRFYSYKGGIYSNLRQLESLNLYINTYNNEICQSRKEEIKQYLCATQFWCPKRQGIDQMLWFLDGIIRIYKIQYIVNVLRQCKER